VEKFFDFFALRVFKIIPKDFGGSQKIRENFFRVREIYVNFFPGKSVHALTANQNYSQPLKNGANPLKPPNSPR